MTIRLEHDPRLDPRLNQSSLYEKGGQISEDRRVQPATPAPTPHRRHTPTTTRAACPARNPLPVQHHCRGSRHARKSKKTVRPVVPSSFLQAWTQLHHLLANPRSHWISGRCSPDTATIQYLQGICPAHYHQQQLLTTFRPPALRKNLPTPYLTTPEGGIGGISAASLNVLGVQKFGIRTTWARPALIPHHPHRIDLPGLLQGR